MATKHLAKKLRAVMPSQSTIDLDEHARKVAEVVTRARGVAVKNYIAATRMRLAERREEDS